MPRGTASPRLASPRLTNFDSLALSCTRVRRAASPRLAYVWMPHNTVGYVAVVAAAQYPAVKLTLVPQKKLILIYVSAGHSCLQGSSRDARPRTLITIIVICWSFLIFEVTALAFELRSCLESSVFSLRRGLGRLSPSRSVSTVQLKRRIVSERKGIVLFI